MKKKNSKRPQSQINKDLKNVNNKHIPINCGRNISASNHKKYKNALIEKVFKDNKYKRYRLSQNPYTDRFISQIKRYNMYNEIWNKSISDEDYFGLSESIKIKQESKCKNNSMMEDKYKANATNTRISSATSTYYDIGYKSKILIKKMYNENNGGDAIYFKAINNIKNNTPYKKLDTNPNTNVDNYREKNEYINTYSNNNPGSELRKNFFYAFNTDNNNISVNNKKGVGTNTSVNVINTSNNLIFRSFNKDFRKEEETMPDTDNRNTINIEDKEKLKKIINNCDTATLNLRTEYLIKLSKLLEMSKKFEQCNDYFRVEKRDIYAQNLKNLTRSFDKCNDYLLNEIKTGEIFNVQSFSNILVYYFYFHFFEQSYLL